MKEENIFNKKLKMLLQVLNKTGTQVNQSIFSYAKFIY